MAVELVDGYRWVLAVLIANVALVGWMAKKVSIGVAQSHTRQ